MAFVNWTENYNTGIPDIDSQHKNLAAIVNDLHGAVKAGQASDKISDILSRLVNYTETHFSLEEELMRKTGCGTFDVHKKLHDDFSRKLQDFQRKYENGYSSVSLEVLVFLRDWLMNHILVCDKLYLPFFRVKDNTQKEKE